MGHERVEWERQMGLREPSLRWQPEQPLIANASRGQYPVAATTVSRDGPLFDYVHDQDGRKEIKN